MASFLRHSNLNVRHSIFRCGVSTLALLILTVAVLPLAAQEPAARRSRPPIVEEEEEPRSAPKPAAAAELPSQIGRLVDEARKAESATLKRFFHEFTQPRDMVVSPNGNSWHAAPLARWFDPKGDRGVSFQTITPNGKLGGRFTFTRDGVRGVNHFENRAISESRRLVAGGSDAPDLSKAAIPRARVLQAAEIVLSEVLRFHVAARERKLRHGKEWSAVEQELRQELFDVRLEQLKDFMATKDWPSAEALAGRLYNEHFASKRLLELIDNLYVTQSRTALTQNQLPLAREKIETLEREFGGELSAAAAAIRKQLQEKAEQLTRQGRELLAKDQNAQALQKLEEAERIWPRLLGLRDVRLRAQKLYPVLRVGVRKLPGHPSPTTALSDIDSIAGRLLFERLVELRAGPSAADGYAYHLGPEPPAATPEGWEFTLGRNLAWSDGRPITGNDVRRSVQVLSDPRTPYYDPAAAELIEVRIAGPQRFTLSLARTPFDPLAVLSFPLLPSHAFPAERLPTNPAFGNKPIGSGPYNLQSDPPPNAQETIFAANPHYRRPHIPDGPVIREVRLVRFDDVAKAKQDLVAGNLQMLLDLTTREKEDLEGKPQVQVLTPTAPGDAKPPVLTNPRVYFLAPNYRRPVLQNEDVRKAIALAIDREKILNEVFRGKDRRLHPPLNGPFPMASWASNPEVPPIGFQEDLARGHVERAKKQVGLLTALALKFPADDPAAASACSMIRGMLEAVGLQINPEAVPPAALAEELARVHPNFDLVYARHDFENELLSLWPLFDPKGIDGRGRNYMGYQGDGELEGLFRELQQRRDFSTLQRRMHDLHRVFAERMIVIPLWQIDRHIAVHRTLKFTRLHPLWVFDQTEQWRLERVE